MAKTRHRKWLNKSYNTTWPKPLLDLVDNDELPSFLACETQKAFDSAGLPYPLTSDDWLKAVQKKYPGWWDKYRKS